MDFVYPTPTTPIKLHNHYPVHYRDIPFNLKLEFNKYKNYFTHRFLEHYAILPREEQAKRDVSYEEFESQSIFIGEGSEGRVIKIDGSDKMCIKEYSIELLSDNIDVLTSIDPTPYLANWYALCRDFKVMEYVEGDTLRDILLEHPYVTSSLTESLKNLLDFVLAEALQGRYINDLSIFNIMRRRDGSCVIVDYENCSTEFFQFPVFLTHAGLSHLARYFYQTLEDLNINKGHCIITDLDSDFDLDDFNENWFENYQEKYGKLKYKNQATSFNDIYQLDYF